MLRKGLASELRYFAVFFFVITFIGFSAGYGLEAIIVALALYLAWMFRNLSKLEHWIYKTRSGKTVENDLVGLWSEIAEDVKLLTMRFEKNKVRLQAVVTRVQDMTSALHDGVILIDGRGNLEWWNRAAGELLGLRAPDTGHRITNILRDPQFQHYFDQEDYSEPLEIEALRNEGKQLLFQVHPYGQGERLIVVRDTTRVAKLEQMRRDFVANVSHELRTPLTVIRGYVETLMDMSDQPPITKRALAQMQQQGMRMTSLVNDLITLTKLETGDRTSQNDEVNLNELVGLVFNDGRAVSGEKHIFQNEVNAQYCLRASEKELRSAISNLVINAVKYTPEGCTIRVYTEQHADHIDLHVEDNGVGIDPKHIPRLTERFYRVDSGRSSQAGGTGLGLAIVKHVLIRHDATLKIMSKPGKGSTFSCGFPSSRLITKAKTA